MNFLIYQDKRGKWRWRLRAENGEILGASSQGFVHRGDCRMNALTLALALNAAINK